MRSLLLVLVLTSLSVTVVFSQTCTVTGTSPLNWPANGSAIVCSEGGNAVGKNVVIIPAGFTVNFNDNADIFYRLNCLKYFPYLKE